MKQIEKKRPIRSRQQMNVLSVILITVFVIISCAGCAGMGSKTVGKQITKDKFKEFFYTYSATVNPPEFQRYRFFVEDGKAFFYHEKREGNKVFLTEEDITVCGTRELSAEEWETFWNFIDCGKVKKKKENVDSGNSGPWLYLYWNGDKDIYREFSFSEDGVVSEFELFCEGLVESMQ